MSREQPSLSSGSPRVDLHSHSFYSDGEHAPEDVAAMAAEAGVVAQALTDHDCLDGIPAFEEAARGFEPIGGVEVSARREGADVHVLGLFVSSGDALFRDRLRSLAARADRIRAMIDRLRELGIPITEESVHRVSPRGTVGRPHVAMALVDLGIVASVKEAFQRFLRPGRPGYVPRPGPDPAAAIAWIHDAGGVAVLAHPGILRRNAWIPELVQAGLDGIEVWHPKHDPSEREISGEMARTLDLVPSGGSDYHGPRVGDARIGQEPVPADVVDRLRERRPRP